MTDEDKEPAFEEVGDVLFHSIEISDGEGNVEYEGDEE